MKRKELTYDELRKISQDALYAFGPRRYRDGMSLDDMRDLKIQCALDAIEEWPHLADVADQLLAFVRKQ